MLQDFINKWNGKYIDILKPGKNCFDVVAQWTNDLGIPHYPNNPTPFPYQYAYQIYLNFTNWQAQYFDRIANELFNSPKAGDIVVYKPGFNDGEGDVVIATGNNSFFTFGAFGQNYPLGGPCSIRSCNYGYLRSNGIYGWLHPKVLDPLTPDQKITKVIAVLNTSGTTDTDKVQKIRQILGV